MLYPFAPKPLLISVSEKDFLGTYSPNYLTNSRLEFNRLKDVYAELGAPENLKWSSTLLPHGLSYDSRLELYNWLQKHLRKTDAAITAEPPEEPARERELWATSSGSAVRDWRSRTPLQLVQEAAKTQVAAKTSLLERVPVDRFASPALRTLGSVPSNAGVTVSAVEAQSAPEIFLPAWLFESKKETANSQVILLLDQRGRNAAWRETDICHSLASNGHMVISADLRGSGDLRAAYSAGNPAYVGDHEDEEAYAWASLILGKPMLGQRATDILALLDAIRAKYNRPVAIAASGKMTTPAIVAAALDPGCSALYLTGGLASFSRLIDEEEPAETFANWLPGALPSEDLPGLLKRLAPRPVVRGPWQAEAILSAFSQRQ
jgi:hypothetical protein